MSPLLVDWLNRLPVAFRIGQFVEQTFPPVPRNLLHARSGHVREDGRRGRFDREHMVTG